MRMTSPTPSVSPASWSTSAAIRPAVLGTGVLEIDDDGQPGALHLMPSGPAAVRWRALFGSPFFHPTTIIDRELLDRHGLRYDTGYEQAQDYELWTRLLHVADGDNMAEALVLRRVHPGQTSKRLRGGQRSFQLEIALRQIAAVAPELSPEEAELAWLVGAGEPVPESAPRGGGRLPDSLRAVPRRPPERRSLRRAGGRGTGGDARGAWRAGR